eukprot:1159228-Pelagomonas_calceolata.AAC.14
MESALPHYAPTTLTERQVGMRCTSRGGACSACPQRRSRSAGWCVRWRCPLCPPRSVGRRSGSGGCGSRGGALGTGTCLSSRCTARPPPPACTASRGQPAGEEQGVHEVSKGMEVSRSLQYSPVASGMRCTQGRSASA